MEALMLLTTPIDSLNDCNNQEFMERGTQKNVEPYIQYMPTDISAHNYHY